MNMNIYLAKYLINELKSALEHYNWCFEQGLYLFAIEQAGNFKRIIATLYSGHYLNELQFRLLYGKGQRMFWNAYHKA